MAIFRVGISKKPKGKIIGYTLVDAKSVMDVKKGPKSRFLGRGRYIASVSPTRLSGTTRSRARLPRSKRFGRGFR